MTEKPDHHKQNVGRQAQQKIPGRKFLSAIRDSSLHAVIGWQAREEKNAWRCQRAKVRSC